MNAISPCRPAFTTDNVQALQDLIGFGMQLARAAAEKALRHLAAPDPKPEESRPVSPDPTMLFTRLWGAIRQTMALQTRLAAAAPESAHVSRPAPHQAPYQAPNEVELARQMRTSLDRITQEIARSRKAEARNSTSLTTAPAIAVRKTA